MDQTIALPSGDQLSGSSPIVIIGPNGSGKTRQSRTLGASPGPIDFVNALRNTRVAPDLPATGREQARQNYSNQKMQSRGQHWEIVSDFDWMLSELLAEYSAEAIRFAKAVEKDPSQAAAGRSSTPLKRVEDLWGDVFPGRQLDWRDWKPIVVSTTAGSPLEYSGNQMSDGEKAALYLAAKVFSSDGGVLVIDEPETHLHSLLAVRLWNALEDARPDIRFVYVTHDLTFAMSRRDPVFVLANPVAGLKQLSIDDSLPAEVAEALLGSASLSFYASRVVFCEGEPGGYDDQFYSAWFNGADTVVRSVGSGQSVLRCVDAIRRSGIASSLEGVGIIDRDYGSSAFLGSMPSGVTVLPVHEIESVFALPEVVAAISKHHGATFDLTTYFEALRSTVDATQERSIVIQRWKSWIEPNLAGVVSSVGRRSGSIEAVATDMSNLFDHTRWPFDPTKALLEEQERVRDAVQGSDIRAFLAVVPGKQLLPSAARFVGMDVVSYSSMIVSALAGATPALASLNQEIGDALLALLPPRHTAPAVPI